MEITEIDVTTLMLTAEMLVTYAIYTVFFICSVFIGWAAVVALLGWGD